MERIEARGRVLAEARVPEVVARVAEVAGAVPGVRAEAGDGRVVLVGHGLRRNAGLRWIGGLLR